MIKLRGAQQRVYNFNGGRMGVSAVPGSGKTFTLSCLAARLIGEGYLNDDQEVLIVTLVNSAVNNFEQRLAGFLRDDYGLLPRIGYRVRTLHGLAHDIVRERPDLCGLSNDFVILDEAETEDILTQTASGWLRSHPQFREEWEDPEATYNSGKDPWNLLVKDIANSFIRLAKDYQLTPVDLQRMLAQLRTPQPLLDMGCEIYTEYQRALNYRSAVDFDDLIRLALKALNSDPELLSYFRNKWPYILEDEAQDSSRLQEMILRLLVGDDGNWVRVGDPNQAIYETFTTADPHFLIDFMHEPGVQAVDLPNSGRSTESVIYLANALIDWTMDEHPVDGLRDALRPPHIKPVEKNDPQPNPPDNPDGIALLDARYEGNREIDAVVNSLKKWLPDHPEATAAVLVPINDRGRVIADNLRAAGLEVVELLRNSLPTREIAKTLAEALRYLDSPTDKNRLLRVYDAYHLLDAKNPETAGLVKAARDMLNTCLRLENYLRSFASDWLEELRDTGTPEDVLDLLDTFRVLVRRWQDAVLLPVDQLILTLSQDFFSNPASLALAHKLALALEHDARTNPDWNLPRFALELESISRNQRRLQGFGDEDTGFDPDKHRGKVVVATAHKAKGLEWDRVYLLSANNYDFPSAQPFDQFISEKKYIRGKLNLEAEILAKLKALAGDDMVALYLPYGLATDQARVDYSAERLRLLYVAITRAKKELVITWNTGKFGNCQPALPFQALRSIWEQYNGHSR